MRRLPGRTRANTHLLFSPCGRYLVAGGSDRGVRIWDLPAGGEPERVLAGGHGVQAMTFTPDGRLVVAFSTGGVWARAGTGESRHFVGAEYTSGDPVALDPAGRWVVAARYELRSFQVHRAAWELADDGTAPERWRVEGSPYTPRLGLPDGSFVADVNGRTLKVIRAADNVTVSEFPSGGSRVHRVAASPSGDRIAWAVTQADGVGADGRGLLFARKMVHNRTAQFFGPDPGRAIAFHPNGRVLAVAGRSGVRFLDADTLAEVRAYDWGTGGLRAVAFAPDGLTAAAASDRGWVVVWDVDT